MLQWRSLEEMSKVAIYGASGHGRVVADIAKRAGYRDTIFIDDGDNEFIEFDIFCKKYSYIKEIVLAIGDNRVRSKIFKKVEEAGFKVMTLIDPTATISQSVKIGRGVVVMPGAIINSDAYISKGVIINSGAVVEHDVAIGAYSHISPNVSLAGGVKVGEFVHVGIGSSVIQNIRIGDNVVVGAGSVVIKDIKDNIVVVGNPAHQIRVVDE